tara:strand:- start:375 stop:806 length:432 start_codon:yes stop_codon:yes gene_type:complete
VTDQIEFSSFYKLLNSIKEGDSEQISLLDKKIDELKDGKNSKSFLEELGSLYLSIGITELYNFTNQKDLHSIGLIDKEEWDNLSIKNEEELPVYLANKMIKYVKENKKIKEISEKWNVKEREIKQHITKMARYITEGIIDAIE